MKKLNLLLVIALLAASLVAAAPQQKLVRLEVINRTGDVINIRLEGTLTSSFYYLTINYDAVRDALLLPASTFTVVPDIYARTTWACGGVQSRGELVMVGNVRLNFTQCDTLPLRTVWFDWNNNGGIWGGAEYYNELHKAPNFGEPTQEKVVFFSSATMYRWFKLPARYGWTENPVTNPFGDFWWGNPRNMWIRSVSRFDWTVGMDLGPRRIRNVRFCSPNCPLGSMLVVGTADMFWWWVNVHTPNSIWWRYRY